jgi:hypothetical protein
LGKQNPSSTAETQRKPKNDPFLVFLGALGVSALAFGLLDAEPTSSP